MKTPHINPLILLLFFFSPEICEAQLINRIKQTAERAASRAVERKVEREVEKAVERKIEKSWTAIFGEQTDADGRPIDFSKIMKGMDMNVTTEDIYDFKGIAILEISGTDAQGKPVDPLLMHTYLTKDQPYGAIKMDNQQSENIIMIFDSKNNASIILMDNNGEKSSIAYAIDWKAITEQSPEVEETTEDFSNIKIQKTGRTKAILGHECEEYTADSEEGFTNYWISKENLGNTTLWSNGSPLLNQKMKVPENPGMNNLPQGQILEMNHASKKDKSTSSFMMKELDSNKKNTFKMKDYPNIMNGAPD